MSSIETLLAVPLPSILGPALAVAGPEVRTFGDPSLRPIIEPRTRSIYETASKPGHEFARVAARRLDSPAGGCGSLRGDDHERQVF
jgi:hypothetical protein